MNPRHPRRPVRLAGLAVVALLAAGLSATSLTPGPATAATTTVDADGTVVVTEQFDGDTLDPQFSVIGSDPTSLGVSGGRLSITGQVGDTYQDSNTARNIVMLDIPVGDFTATTTLTAPVARTFQGAGLIAWQDIDNYVRSGLTFVGTGLTPSAIGIENDVETNGVFRAARITDRPASQGETLRMQRVGNTITTSYLGPDGTFVTASSVEVTFETTQVGLYALGAQDGTTLAAAFDDLVVRHADPTVAPTDATLAIDGDGSGVDINDDMFGIFYEDINYAADGGLYAELVRNRSFEFNDQDNRDFTALTGWSPVGDPQLTPVDDVALALDPATNRTHLRVVSTAAGQGVRNASYNNGVALAEGATYEGYLWARTPTPQTLTVDLEGADGDVVGTVAVPIAGDTWTKYPFTLTSSATTDAGRLAVLTGAASTVALDMISLMPTDRWVGAVNGTSVLRKDIAEKIADMDPGFVRFPGGCVTNVGSFGTYAETGERRRTYQWKETLGPVEKRPTNWNFWGYNQSYGIGYLEYFEFAEDLGAEALPVVSVGANGCGGAGIPEMQVGDANFDRWVDDTRDIIEFANGDAETTEWGKVRAELGHPEPFGLEYIGLGNEENTPTFEANFPAFRDAVTQDFPDIKIISNSGPDSSGGRFDTLWRYNREQQVDLVDEHYYRSPAWFQANNRRYDSYDRSADAPKVFLGEYASRFNSNNNDASNLNFANGLSEAAYMTALQRNADVVQLASYAPLLANESALQWSPDAIFFDNDESWARPSWHVQTMFGQDPGTETVPSTLDASANQAPDVSGGVFLSTWNTAADYDDVTVTDNATGASLFSDDFAAGAGKWSRQSGAWTAPGGADGGYRQTATDVTDARSIVTGAYDQDWDNYTLELDATKRAGREGFLIGFGAQDPDDFYWYNLGGFDNTRALLQKASGGPAQEVATPPAGSGVQSVRTGTTYRVKIVVDGSSIEIYVDGELQISYDTEVLSESLYQVVTRDEDAGTITAKVVNTAATPVSTRILTSDVALAPTAQVTTLTGDPRATNTKTDPDRIAPRTSTLDGVSNDFVHTFPEHSVSFVTMQVTGTLPPTTSPPVVTPPTTTPPTTTPPPAGAPVVTVTAPRKVRAGKRPRVSLAVSSAPAGAVASVVVTRTVVRTVDGRKKRKSKTVLATQVPVVGGAATLRLPRLRPGKHVVTTTYAGPGGTTTDRTVIRVEKKGNR